MYYMSKILTLITASSLLFITACSATPPPAPGKYAAVSQCLTDKGVIMYGAYWCPHCAAQKKRFGTDFQYIHYQECDDKGSGGDHALCVKNKITGYPTWIFPGQGRLSGEQEVRNLAKLANCVDDLPQADQNLLKKETFNINLQN